MKHTQNRGFVKLTRCAELEYLAVNHPGAAALLQIIAMRARWQEEPCPVTGLRRGEAFVGPRDCASRSTFRHALKVLERGKFATSRTTNRGTTVTLLETSGYGIFCEASDQPSDRHATTKKKASKKNKEKSSADTLAFEGDIIRLTGRDLDKWVTSFPMIDVPGTLTAADAYFLENPKKDWYFRAAAWLKREQDRVVSQAEAASIEDAQFRALTE